MIARLRSEQEGQVFPALLLAVAFIVFLGFAWGQVGEVADQRTQTQTAADAGAVAAGSQLRRQAVLAAIAGFPTPLRGVLSSVGASGLGTACLAANRNWTANRHDTPALPCSDVAVDQTGRATVRVDLRAPSGELSDGPVTGNGDTRVSVHSGVRVRFDRCPQASSLDQPLSAATALVAARLVDGAATQLGEGPTGCSDGLGLGVGLGWGALLGPLLSAGAGSLPPEVADALSAIDPVQLAEQSFRVEIVD